MPAKLNSKSIAKNTILLYIRMLLTIIVGLYTSRIVLNTLGVSDFGIYNIVGGIVSMLAFLNTAMVASSQRYISFELGTENMDKLKRIFCTSISIHIVLAGIIFFIAETLGLWLVNAYLNIPIDRIGAANWVYQCSIITLILTVISVPYNSCIVAHEHMKIYAYISIVEAILKLLVVYILLIWEVDKLILYAILIVVVNLITRTIYYIYCKRHFEECTFHFISDSRLFKEMFSFAGWSVVGNLGFSFKDQGSNIILNLFFGTIVNAARGIALQVNGIICNFSNSFTMALNPQITKQYAAGNIESSVKLVYAGCRYSFFLLLLITIPVVINIDYLLELWLGIVPEYTSQFLILSLVAALINVMSPPIVTALQATGEIKLFQIAICIVMLSELPLAYLILYYGGKPYMAMYPTIIIMVIGLIVRFVLLKRIIPVYQLHYFIVRILGRNFFVGVICFALSLWIRKFFNQDLLNLIITSILAVITSSIFIYVIGLSLKEQIKIKTLIINKIHDFKKFGR